MANEARNSQVLGKINKNIEAGNFYEALQLYKLLNSRFVGSRKYKDANDLLRTGITTFFSKGQPTLATELFTQLIDNFKANKAPLDQSHLSLIKELFSHYPATHDTGKSSVMRVILKWAEDSKNKDGEEDLQGYFAEVLWQEKDYGNAQKHFVKSARPERLADMLQEWSSEGKQQERDLFLARGVFMYLCLNNIPRAKALFEYFLRHNPDLKTPLVNFLKFLLTACEHGRFDLFDTIRKKYQPSLSRDPNFTHFLDKIAQVVFKVNPSGASAGLQGIFGDFMRNLFSSEPPTSEAISPPSVS